MQCRDSNTLFFYAYNYIFLILKYTPLKLWDDVLFIRALEIIPLRFGSFYHFTFRNSLLSMNFSWDHLISPWLPDPVSQLISWGIVLLRAYWNATTLTLRAKFRGNTRSNQGCHVFCIYPLCSRYATYLNLLRRGLWIWKHTNWYLCMR